MTRMRKTLLGASVLIVLLVLGGFIFLATLDVDQYRQAILERLEQTLHRPVQASKVELGYFPLSLRLTEVVVSDSPDFPGEFFFKAQAVAAEASLSALLWGEIAVTSFQLDRPQLFLRQNASGTWNLSQILEAPGDEEASGTSESGGAPVTNWGVRGGEVTLTPRNRSPILIRNLDFELRDIRLDAPFPVELRAGFEPGGEIEIDGSLGPLDLDEPSKSSFAGQVRAKRIPLHSLSSFYTPPSLLAWAQFLNADLDLSRDGDGTSVEGVLSLVDAENIPHQLRLQASIRPDGRLTIRQSQLTVHSTVLDARGWLLQGSPTAFDIKLGTQEASIHDLVAILPRLGIERNFPPLTGVVQAELSLSGTSEDWRIEGTVGGRDLSLAAKGLEGPVRASSVSARISPTEIQIEPFEATHPSGLKLRLSLHLRQYRKAPLLSLKAEGSDLEAASVLGLSRALGADPLPGGSARGRITGNASGSAPLADLASMRISADGQIRDLEISPAGWTQSLRIRSAGVVIRPNAWKLSDFEAAAGSGVFRGNLEVQGRDATRVAFDIGGDQLILQEWQSSNDAVGTTSDSDPSVPDWFQQLSGAGKLRLGILRTESLTLSPFSADVKADSGRLVFDPIDIGFYKGIVRGRLAVDFSRPKPATAFEGQLERVDANQLLAAITDSKSEIFGLLGGDFDIDFSGADRPDITRTAKGRGELRLTQGRLAKVNLKQELAFIAKLAGLPVDRKDTPIEDMTTTFRVADGWVRTDDLRLASPDMTVLAEGGSSLDGELDFRATALFDPEASRQVQGPPTLLGLLNLTFLRDEQGRVVIPFLVRGTSEQPKFTLDGGRLLRMGVGGPSNPLQELLDKLKKPRG